MKRIDISGLEKNRGIYMKLGFIAALSFVMMAFNYTSHSTPFDGPPMEIEKDKSPEIPVTTHKEKKKLPPPPKPKSFDKIIETDVPEFVEEPVKISLKIEENPVDDFIDDYIDEPNEEPYIPEEVEEIMDEPEEEPVLFAEFMPMFGDCDEKLNPAERKACSDKALFCLLYTSPSPRDATLSRMPSSA